MRQKIIKMIDCKFCNKFNKKGRSDELYDKVLFESENFVVVPTMGSLVEDWVLVVSKNHFINSSQLDNTYNEELNNVITTTKKNLEHCNGKVYVFEHGPYLPKQSVGCGIDHLHIHIVPLKFNLFETARKNRSFNWEKLPSRNGIMPANENNLPFLFIETPENDKHICLNSNIPSQFFRRLIADEMGIADKFDWKLNYGSENIKKTLKKFSQEIEFV